MELSQVKFQKLLGFSNGQPSVSTSFLPSLYISKTHPTAKSHLDSFLRAATLAGEEASLCKGAIWWRCRDEQWKGSSHHLGFSLPTHLSRTTLMVLRPRAAAIWMTACPTPLLDAFWMIESPVEPGRDSSQVLETRNRSRASSLRSYYVRQEMECLGSKGTWDLAAEPSQTLECCSLFPQ